MKRLLTLMFLLAVEACDMDSAEAAPAQLSVAGAAGLDVEGLNACTAGKNKIKARYGCVQPWTESSNELRNTSGTCSGGRDYLAFVGGSTAPSGFVKFEVDSRTHQTGDGHWKFQQFVQCSCNDSGPCTTVSSLAADSDSDSDSDSDGQGAGAAEPAAAMTKCSTSTTIQYQALNQSMKHYTGADYKNCHNETFIGYNGSAGATWQCGAAGSHTAQERLVRLQDLWNGACVYRLEQIAYGGGAWSTISRSECNPGTTDNPQMICFYYNE